MMRVERKTGFASRNVILLGVVSFLNDLSSEMILPILPMFISSLGGTGLAVGIIGGLRDSISSILKVFSGYLSDRTGRRKIFVFSGYMTSSVFKLLLAFSRTWQHILLFSSLERVGKGLRTAPRDAIIADSMPREKGKGFGIHRSLDTLGAIIGSILTFSLFWILNMDFRSIILVSSAFAFLSLLPLYPVKEARVGVKRYLDLKVSLKDLPVDLKYFILISSTFALSNFSYMFLILKTQEILTGRFSIAIPILLYVFFNVFYAFFSVPFGVLSDRIGRKRVLMLGYTLFSLICMGFVSFKSLTSFTLLFALYGIFHAIIDGNQRAYVSDLSPREIRATALGTFHTATGLSALPSNLIAGILWQINTDLTFIYGAAVSIFSVILFAKLVKTR